MLKLKALSGHQKMILELLFGKILRKTRFDEIPQLYSVLKGEMSLIGPRPERPEIEKLSRKILNFIT